VEGKSCGLCFHISGEILFAVSFRTKECVLGPTRLAPRCAFVLVVASFLLVFFTFYLYFN